jgi:hypothetical protein
MKISFDEILSPNAGNQNSSNFLILAGFVDQNVLFLTLKITVRVTYFQGQNIKSE